MKTLLIIILLATTPAIATASKMLFTTNAEVVECYMNQDTVCFSVQGQTWSIYSESKPTIGTKLRVEFTMTRVDENIIEVEGLTNFMDFYQVSSVKVKHNQSIVNAPHYNHR